MPFLRLRENPGHNLKLVDRSFEMEAVCTCGQWSTYENIDITAQSIFSTYSDVPRVTAYLTQLHQIHKLSMLGADKGDHE